MKTNKTNGTSEATVKSPKGRQTKAQQAINDRMAAMREAKAAKALAASRKPRKAPKATSEKAVQVTRTAKQGKPASKPASQPVVRQRHRGEPLYRGDYGRVFDIGSHKVMTREELIKAAAKELRKSPQQIAFDLQVLTNPKHRSNGMKSCNIAKRKGFIRLAPYKAA